MEGNQPNQPHHPKNTMTYSSRQDFSTDLAVSQSSILRLNREFSEYFSRTQKAADEVEFERLLHQSMGWKSSTRDDWA